MGGGVSVSKREFMQALVLLPEKQPTQCVETTPAVSVCQGKGTAGCRALMHHALQLWQHWGRVFMSVLENYTLPRHAIG